MSYRSKSLSKLLKQIDDEYKDSFLPVVLPHNCLDALLAVKPDLRYWRGQGEHCLVCASPPLPIKQDPSGRPDRLGMVNGRLKTLRALPLEEKVALAYRVLDRMFEVTDAVAVAFSGGRDSLVALHLTLQRRRDVKVVFVNTSIEFPETLKYVRELAQTWGFEFHEVSAEKNFWELSHERGLPIGGRGNQFFLAELSEASGVKLSNACCNQLKITPARQFYREAGIDAQVTGLRVDESMMRRFNFADYGALRYSRDYDTLVAWPIFAWSIADLMAYVEQHQLPLNPLYAMGHQRVGCWSCLQDFFKTDSGLFTLKRTHPGMYKSLKHQFGEEMLAILTAWGGIQKHGFTLEQFDGLYTPCDLELLDPKHRKKRPDRKKASE